MPKKIIYAEDAIDALKAMALPLHLDSACEDIWERDRTLDNAIDVMRGLPSAHPEIIRCKDCKYSHMTYDGDCKYCDIWFPDEPEYMPGDYYCGSAERRQDE